MSTLSSSTGSLHDDIRSSSRSYKRDKDRSTKWARGTRPSPGVKQTYFWDPAQGRSYTTGSPEQQAKVRPMPQWNNHNKHTGNSSKSWDVSNAVAHRISRKQDHNAEITSESTLSRSLTDLLPTSPLRSRNGSLDTTIYYTYDAPTAPRKAVGLDQLVERAEREFVSRETDKIVRDEYEILDESGEVKTFTKKGKKGSPRQRAETVVREEEEDDWEQI